MAKVIDLKEQKFGRLTVLERDFEVKSSRAYWVCKCECGVVKTICGKALRNGTVVSCGCWKREKLIERNIEKKQDLVGKVFGCYTVLKRDHDGDLICECKCGAINKVTIGNLKREIKYCVNCQSETTLTDIVGQKFNYLTVVSLHSVSPVKWKCLCDCGNETIVDGRKIRGGHTISCGVCVRGSLGEKRINDALLELDVSFKREYVFQDYKSARYDFVIFNDSKEISSVIEFDGEQHFKESNFFNKTLKEQQQKDFEKSYYLEKNGIRLIRIPYWERDKIDKEYVLKILEEVL